MRLQAKARCNVLILEQQDWSEVGDDWKRVSNDGSIVESV